MGESRAFRLSRLRWRYLFSRFVSKQVFSARVSLTSVFGMGTGGPSPQSTPTYFFLKEKVSKKNFALAPWLRLWDTTTLRTSLGYSVQSLRTAHCHHKDLRYAQFFISLLLQEIVLRAYTLKTEQSEPSGWEQAPAYSCTRT